MKFFKKKYIYISFAIILAFLILIYILKKNNFIELFSNYNLNDNKDNKITVVLNVFKRPHTLIEQINAVKNQTISPSEIIVYKNYAENYEMPQIPSNLNDNITIIESTKNYGVWARFAIALFANTEYVCVFDDDTIPGKKWFENCINTMKKTPGLLGTNGIIFKKGDVYEAEENPGWHGKNQETREVDIVGHSWFFKREWLAYLWKFVPSYKEFLKRGEDIAFSALLQKHNIKTYTPPHPENDLELWGSIPEKGNKYGSENVGISVENNNANHTLFDEALKYFIYEEGFKTIMNR